MTSKSTSPFSSTVSNATVSTSDPSIACLEQPPLTSFSFETLEHQIQTLKKECTFSTHSSSSPLKSKKILTSPSKPVATKHSARPTLQGKQGPLPRVLPRPKWIWLSTGPHPERVAFRKEIEEKFTQIYQTLNSNTIGH